MNSRTKAVLWLAFVAACVAFAATLQPVASLAGGTANRVLTDDGTRAVWSTQIAAAAVPSLDTSKLTTGTVATARLGSGTANSSSYLAGNSVWTAFPTSLAPSGSAGGDLTGTYPNPTLATSGVTATTYGGATAVPVLTIDAKGRVTSAATATPTVTAVNSVAWPTSAVLGSMPYGSAANTMAFLAPNTTSTNKFFSMTGTGTVGATPAWSTLVAGDLPNHSTSLLTSGQLALARGGTGVDLSAGGGTTYVLAQDASHVVSARALVAADIPSLAGSVIASGSVGATVGGTGITSYTAGDTLYASATNVLSKLAGNTTATKKYYSMTSSVPSYGVIALADLGTGTPSSSTYLRGDGTWTAGTTAAGGSTTQVQFNSSGTISGDAGMTYGGVGASGSVLLLSPTNTGASVYAASLPASFQGNLINLLDSSSSPNFRVFQDSGGNTISWLTSRSGTTNKVGSMRVGRVDYPTTGQSLGSYTFGNIASGTLTANAFMTSVADENQDATHLGSNLQFATSAAGGTSSSYKLKITGAGDIVLNATGSALTTGATAGFTFLPNMAGFPSGSPTSYTGATGVTYDTTHDLLVGNNSTWKATTVSNGVTTTQSGNYTHVANVCTIFQTGTGTDTLVDPSTVPAGFTVRIVCTGANAVTIATAAGSITGTTTTAAFCVFTAISDGSTKWYVTKTS